MKDYTQPAKTIPRVDRGQNGHEADWVRACKEGPDGRPASSTFEYGAALTELALLGTIAIRMKDQRLVWDSANLKFSNNAKASELLHIPYRTGWSL